MKYHGKLYGKLLGKYFDTDHTTDEWDAMEKEIKQMKITDEILEKWFKKTHQIKTRNDYHKMIELTLGELYEEIHVFLLENKLIEIPKDVDYVAKFFENFEKNEENENL